MTDDRSHGSDALARELARAAKERRRLRGGVAFACLVAIVGTLIAINGSRDRATEVRGEVGEVRDRARDADRRSKSVVEYLRGEPGIAGGLGPRGARGASGPPGLRGSARRGLRGLPGPSGVRGPAGESGSTGLIGGAGPTGSQGPAGERGGAGGDGARGAPGPPGSQGEPGPAGPQGPDGATGQPGPEFDPSGRPLTCEPNPDPAMPGTFVCEFQ